MFGHLTRAPLPAGPAHRQDQSAYPAFCELAVRLYTPNLNNLGAKSAIVSGLHLKYSRFLETRARDRARSALRGVVRHASANAGRKAKLWGGGDPGEVQERALVEAELNLMRTGQGKTGSQTGERSMTVIEHLANWAAGAPRKHSSAARDVARHAIEDVIACMIAGSADLGPSYGRRLVLASG